VVGPAVAADSAEEGPVAAGSGKKISAPIPLWAHDVLHERDLVRIAEAVKAVEATTQGEIVPMIVKKSSVAGYLPFQITLVMLVALLVLEVPQADFFAQFNAYWVLFFLAAFCYGISILLSRNSLFQRFFIPVHDQIFQVEARAHLEFYLQGLNNTKKHTGVLLFISLMERRAVVLADQAIAQKTPQETWEQVCLMLVDGVKKGQTGEGFAKAIHKCGEYLTQHFPLHGTKSNELGNQLIIKE
jgi:putative membrane protein